MQVWIFRSWRLPDDLRSRENCLRPNFCSPISYPTLQLGRRDLFSDSSQPPLTLPSRWPSHLLNAPGVPTALQCGIENILRHPDHLDQTKAVEMKKSVRDMTTTEAHDHGEMTSDEGQDHRGVGESVNGSEAGRVSVHTMGGIETGIATATENRMATTEGIKNEIGIATEIINQSSANENGQGLHYGMVLVAPAGCRVLLRRDPTMKDPKAGRPSRTMKRSPRSTGNQRWTSTRTRKTQCCAGQWEFHRSGVRRTPKCLATKFMPFARRRRRSTASI
jgi:hypothetical protein